MRTFSRRTALGAALALAAGGASAAPVVRLLPSGDMSLGDPKARIEVVEYASLSCGHCGQFNADVFPAFKAKYVDTGRVRYVLREFLTQPPEVAAAGFILARCGGPSRYFEIVDAMFRAQALWMTGASVRSVLLSVGRSHGLTEAQILACLADEGARNAVNARHARAVAAGIHGTPTFLVNGKELPTHSVTLSDLDAAIAAAGKT